MKAYFRYDLIVSWLLACFAVVVNFKVSAIVKETTNEILLMPPFVIGVILVMHAVGSLLFNVKITKNVFSHFFSFISGCYVVVLLYWFSMTWLISGTLLGNP